MTLKEQLDLVEQKIILRIMAACGDNRTMAAIVLNISRSTMMKRLAMYRKRGVDIPDTKHSPVNRW
jgi:DNA-binding protein Fis